MLGRIDLSGTNIAQTSAKLYEEDQHALDTKVEKVTFDDVQFSELRPNSRQ